jgi:tRNA threonylcarbamoyladenosine biosynthesis protein TsaB
MIRILHLETSTKVCSVALSADGKLIELEELLTDEFPHSENLTVFIQNVLKRASIDLKMINAVSVTAGPGSYTGLRIGVSTAKGLCYALGIPLISVDSLTSMAMMAHEKHPGKTLCAMIDARRREVYGAIYNTDLQMIKPISADVLDERSYHEFEPFVYFGDGAEKMVEEWSSRNCTADLEIYASAQGQVSIAFEKYTQGEFEDVAYFEPFYLKDFLIQKPASKEKL